MDPETLLEGGTAGGGTDQDAKSLRSEVGLAASTCWSINCLTFSLDHGNTAHPAPGGGCQDLSMGESKGTTDSLDRERKEVVPACSGKGVPEVVGQEREFQQGVFTA